jgi:hypothetical protein
MADCKTITFPEWAESSEQYRELFNTVAAENDFGIKWHKEAEGFGTPNIPDPGEVEVTRKKWKRYGITEGAPRKFNPLLAEDICQIRQEIETRITEMNKAGLDFFPILKSGTYTHDKMSQTNIWWGSGYSGGGQGQAIVVGVIYSGGGQAIVLIWYGGGQAIVFKY